MDAQRKKQLREGYKTRRPDMGVLVITCTATGDAFLFVSKDAANGFNRHTFQLGAGMHPNKALQRLWNDHGEGRFTFEVAGLIKYDDPAEDVSDKLEDLLAESLARVPHSQKL